MKGNCWNWLMIKCFRNIIFLFNNDDGNSTTVENLSSRRNKFQTNPLVSWAHSKTILLQWNENIRSFMENSPRATSVRLLAEAKFHVWEISSLIHFEQLVSEIVKSAEIDSHPSHEHGIWNLLQISGFLPAFHFRIASDCVSWFGFRMGGCSVSWVESWKMWKSCWNKRNGSRDNSNERTPVSTNWRTLAFTKIFYWIR